MSPRRDSASLTWALGVVLLGVGLPLAIARAFDEPGRALDDPAFRWGLGLTITGTLLLCASVGRRLMDRRHEPRLSVSLPLNSSSGFAGSIKSKDDIPYEWEGRRSGGRVFGDVVRFDSVVVLPLSVRNASGVRAPNVRAEVVATRPKASHSLPMALNWRRDEGDSDASSRHPTTWRS